jgi:uncharacterized protein (TIGR03118 family)
MHSAFFGKRTRRTVLFVSSFILCAGLIAAFRDSGATRVHSQNQQDGQQPNIPNIAPGAAYRQTNLLADVPGLAPVLDPLLVNPWGLTVRGTSPFWVANNGTGTTQLIRDPNGAGPVVLNASPQTITIPGGLPTGAVGNATLDFQITPPGGGAPAASNFIFDSITGHITAWNGASGASAQNVVSMPGHVWTGLAIGVATGGNRLYAADFEMNHIDVFNGTFTTTTVPGGFIDVTVPADYHPHNIQIFGSGVSASVYVTYAKYDPTVPVTHRATGVGLGLVRKFDTDGARDVTFAISDVSINPTSQLNAPWGVAIAPGSFGIFGGALLIGNFGDENPSIHAYNPSTGAVLNAGDNALKNEDGEGIVIDELWALQFGNGGNGGDVNTLYFTAGPADEEHGLFGKLNPTTATATSLVEFASPSTSVDEAGKFVDITVIRTGDTSGTATVNYNTFDESEPGHASQKSDYEIALGTLTFAPGETSKSFRILVVNDTFDEDDETIDLFLSNPTGAGVGLGSPNTAEVNILDNDTGASVNLIDDASFFVRQHFLDFTNREPGTSEFNALVGEINGCGPDTACIDTRRNSISQRFFLSPDFQRTGYLSYLTHRAAFGPKATGAFADVAILYGNFERDLQALQRGFVPTAPGSDAVLEANKVAYFNEFVTRPEFVFKYPSTLTNGQYVDNLLASAGLSPSQVRQFVVSLTNSQEVPPTVPTTTLGAARPASFGTARFQLNDAQTAMSFLATINNIDVTGLQTGDINDNLIAAHIHAGASVAPGVNGPVVWGFFGAPFNDNNPNDAFFFPNLGVGGTFGGKWDAPEGNGTTLGAQLANLREGRAYINFHTRQFGGGEIRGNFPAADSFRNQLVAALNGATMTRAQVLRAIAETDELNTREQNRAFAAMVFFAYDRRDPDASGYTFMLNRLDALVGFHKANMAEMFLRSSEYRQRFGPVSDPLANDFANDPPIANNDAASTNAATPVVIDVITNDSDPDGDNLTITSVTTPTGGTTRILSDGRSILFSPSPGFAGPTSFQYQAADNGMSCGPGCSHAPQDFDYTPLTASATVNVNVVAGGTFGFSAATASVGEGAGKLTLTVTLTGGVATPVDVAYSTAPDAASLTNCTVVNGLASEKCDYNTASGVLRFNPGETSKTFDIFITDDGRVEGAETFTVNLTNPGVAGFSLGTSTVTVSITDNDAAPSATNPIDDIPFFVRMLYIDFLAREPDTIGFNNYVTEISGCPGGGFGLSHPECDRVRATISFFNSPEFGERGYVVYRYYDAALARLPQYGEFIRDLRRIGGAASPAEGEAAKVALFNDYVASAEFQGIYGGLTDAAHASQYVAKLETTAGVTLPEPFRSNLISQMGAGTLTAAQVLRQFVEHSVVFNKFYNRGFTSMMYFALLHRNPDPIGFANYVNQLNSTGDQRAVTFGFIYSTEYRLRFGTP